LGRRQGPKQARFRPVAPVWSAPVDVDDKKAWDGSLPGQPDIPLHIEAGAYHGRIDWFRIFGPWNAPVSPREPAQPPLTRVSVDVGTWIPALLLTPAVILAIRNFRRGRGDRRGAFRLACAITATTAIALLFRADHAAGPEESHLIDIVLARSLGNGVLVWLVYMALEPYMRRKLPHTLIGWSRLLAGRVRDPMVGRDVLIGVLAGAAVISTMHVQRLLPPQFGVSAPPMQSDTTPLASVRQVAFLLLDIVRGLTFATFEVMFIVVVFRVLFRRQSVAVTLAFLVFSIAFAGSFAGNTMTIGGSIALPLLVSGLCVSVILYVLLRWGLLAAIVLGAVWGWLYSAPLTLDATLWYAGRSFLVLAACAALALYGFVVSLGGKSMFGRPLFEE
jgi:eukaryotic-like serine/threonine-protein kinase